MGGSPILSPRAIAALPLQERAGSARRVLDSLVALALGQVLADHREMASILRGYERDALAQNETARAARFAGLASGHDRVVKAIEEAPIIAARYLRDRAMEAGR